MMRKIAIAAVGIIFGASVLHAQKPPPAYMFAEIDVKDEDTYTKEMLPATQTNLKAVGGRYLAGGFNKGISLSGSAPANRVVLLEFPSLEAMQAFYAAQKPLEQNVGGKYAKFRVIGIVGVQP